MRIQCLFMALAGLCASPNGPTALARAAADTPSASHPSERSKEPTDPRIATGPTIGKSVLGSGGGPTSSATRKLLGTVGQAFVGYTTGPPPVTKRVCSGWWCAQLGTTTSTPDDSDLPKVLSFGRPRPNPSNGDLTLDMELPKAAHVDVRLVDVLGRHVRTLASGRFEPGKHALSWNGRSDAGFGAHAGVYFMRILVDGGEVARRQIVVIR